MGYTISFATSPQSMASPLPHGGVQVVAEAAHGAGGPHESGGATHGFGGDRVGKSGAEGERATL